jgi:hypothetical protein
VVSSFSSAISSLNAAINGCRANSAGAGCSAILAQGPALLTGASGFSAAVTSLYGTNSSTPGEPVIPLANSTAQAAINQQIRNFASQFQSLLGTAPIPAQDTLLGAQSLLANFQLNGLLTELGHDTLQSTNRSSIGDVSIGARFQLADTFDGDTTDAGLGALHYRLAVSGTFRFGTGEPANRNRFFDLSTGYGQPGVEGAVAADVAHGRHLSATVTGSYTAQLGSIDINRVPNAANAAFPLGLAFPGTFSAGNVLALSAIPRWRIGGYFALDGHYNLINVGADKYTLGAVPTSVATIEGNPLPILTPTTPSGSAAGTVQQIGIGFSYSTVNGAERGPGAIPAEIVYSHLETMSISGGPLPKTFRDQIEVRLYVIR